MKVPVYIEAVASKHIGDIEIESWNDYYAAAEKLWESKGYDVPTLNCHNNFDLSEFDITELEQIQFEEGL